MKDYYRLEKWYLAELLLLLAEDDAVNAADMKKALNTEDGE